LGYAHVLGGRLAEGLPLLEQAAAQVKAIGRSIEQASILGWLAETYLLAGRPKEALDEAQLAFQLAHDSKQRGKQAHTLRTLAQIHAERGPSHVSQAEGCFRRALELAEELGMCPLQAHCHAGLGGLYRRTGQILQAVSELSAAVELYRQTKMTLWLSKAESDLAEASDPLNVKV